MFRRECIHAFRLVMILGRYVEWDNVSDNTVGRMDHFPFNEPRMVINVLERINPFPTNTYRQIPISRCYGARK